jgi:hypothetical protein
MITLTQKAYNVLFSYTLTQNRLKSLNYQTYLNLIDVSKDNELVCKFNNLMGIDPSHQIIRPISNQSFFIKAISSYVHHIDHCRDSQSEATECSQCLNAPYIISEIRSVKDEHHQFRLLCMQVFNFITGARLENMDQLSLVHQGKFTGPLKISWTTQSKFTQKSHIFMARKSWPGSLCVISSSALKLSYFIGCNNKYLQGEQKGLKS